MNYLVSTTILLVCLVKSFAQNEFATIPLDTSLGDVHEMLQFSGGQSHILFKFQGEGLCQYSLLQQEKMIESKTLELGDKFNLLGWLYDENHFSLFYRNKKDKKFYVYSSDEQLLQDHLLEANIQEPEEKHLAGVYNQGDFLIFNYLKSPFALHTYRYKNGQHFEKQSQAFQNSKREKMFIGQILTDNEAVFVRLTMNPFTMHFYRYFKDRGFEKKSIEIRPLYNKIGIKGKRIFASDVLLNASSKLNASIQGSHVYVDMENLIHINPTLSKKENMKTHPGVLRLNWDGEEGEILSFNSKENFKFINRSVALLENLYFVLLVNKDALELSIYDVTSQKLLKKYTYKENQEIDLIHGDAWMNKKISVGLDLFSTVFFPIGIGDGHDKLIDNKTLLKNLSAETLFLDVFSDENIIELQITGMSQKEIFVDQTLTASFVGYLSKANLEIIKNFDDLEDPRWAAINEYIQELTKTNKNIGEFMAFPYQEHILVAFIDKKQRHCKIVAY